MATETFTLTLDNTPTESVSVTINDTSVPTEVLINEQLEIEQSRSFVSNAIDTTFEFKPDGTVLWVGTTGVGATGDERIIEYSLSTAWDLSTATATGNVLDVDSPGGNISVDSMVVNPDGDRLFLVGARDTNYQKRIQQYNIGTAWDLSTHNSVPNYNLNLPSWDSTKGVGQMFFEPDGRKIWIAMYDNFGTHYINRYDLFSAWSLSGYSTGQSVSLSGSGSSNRPEMVTYNHNGTVFAFQRSVNNGIEVFELSTAYGYSSSSTRTRFVQPAIVSGSTVLTGLTRIKFYDDGKKMFAATGNTIYELRNGSYETQRAYVRDNGTNSAYNFYNGDISGNNPTISMNVNDVLVFDMQAQGHPLWIKEQRTTGRSDALNFTTNGRDQAVIIWRPDTAGTYYYNCEFHSAMSGQIVVSE